MPRSKFLSSMFRKKTSKQKSAKSSDNFQPSPQQSRGQYVPTQHSPYGGGANRGLCKMFASVVIYLVFLIVFSLFSPGCLCSYDVVWHFVLCFVCSFFCEKLCLDVSAVARLKKVVNIRSINDIRFSELFLLSGLKFIV